MEEITAEVINLVESVQDKVFDVIYRAKWYIKGHHIGQGEIEIDDYFIENEDEVFKKIEKILKEER